MPEYLENWRSASCSVKLKFCMEIIFWLHIAEFSNCSAVCFNLNLLFLKTSESCKAQSILWFVILTQLANQLVTMQFRLNKCLPAALTTPSCFTRFIFSRLSLKWGKANIKFSLRKSPVREENWNDKADDCNHNNAIHGNLSSVAQFVIDIFTKRVA